jgi:hypothetical protein
VIASMPNKVRLQLKGTNHRYARRRNDAGHIGRGSYLEASTEPPSTCKAAWKGTNVRACKPSLAAHVDPSLLLPRPTILRSLPIFASDVSVPLGHESINTSPSNSQIARAWAYKCQTTVASKPQRKQWSGDDRAGHPVRCHETF